MRIHISSAVGQGLTELAAFDSALAHLGVRDQNLIYLSSVIPLNAELVRGRVDFNNQFLGDRVYCVCSEKRTDTRGSSVAAGIGWVTTKEEPAWGLFVEHTDHTEEEVKKHIQASLTSMVEYRKEHTWSDPQMEITSITCESEPVCAISLAVYKREPWQ